MISIQSETVKVRFDPSLMEEVVLHELRRREEKGDLSCSRDYHIRSDSIYERFRPEVREAEFEKLHRKFFTDFGFAEIIRKILMEFPEIAGLEEVFVGKAQMKGEESADLSRDRRRAGIKIHPEQFLDPSGLPRCLRHELGHVADMLDDTFGYLYEEGFPVGSPAAVNLIKNRYRTIWDIYIDGRLQRNWKETISDKEGRLREFEAIYPNISSSQRVAAFEALWGAERLTHSEILEMAMDPNRALQKVGTGLGFEPRVFLPGALCPLCFFPTFHWADGLDELPREALEPLKRDFPMWEPEQGACERCIEVYKASSVKKIA